MHKLPGKREKEPAGTRRSWADIAPDIVTGAIGVALVVFALWGFWIAADVARPAGDPNPNIATAERNLTAFKFFLTWLVLFAPFFLLGAAILWSTFKKKGISRIWGLMGTINQIMPLWLVQSRYGRLAGQFQGYEMEKPLATNPAASARQEPLDDETVRRIDRAGYLAAKALGAIVGGLLVVGGILGLVLDWLDARQPAQAYSSLRFSMAFLTFCLAAAVIGFVILRDTFRPEQRAWLAPLRMFSFIVGLRAVADIVKRDYPKQAGARTLPGEAQRSLLPPADSAHDRDNPA